MHATFRQYLMFHEFKYILYNCYSQYKYLGQEVSQIYHVLSRSLYIVVIFFLMHILVIYVTQNGV